MADRFDVAARLAEGRPAVEHTQTYVQACHVLGYQHPDLTAHSSQIGDWYDTEVGLDLRVLDADVAELRAAVNAIEEALWVQRAQVTELATTWRGPGADAATQFVRRHCDAAAEVAAHVRAATEACSALRDDVWQSVDRKVATAVAIDDRRLAERSTWLAAAHTVTAGTGDQPAVADLIRQQVNPYVDNDIRNDWVTAMRSTAASVRASYDRAIHAVSSAPEVRFEVPGELGPSWQPVFDEPLRPCPGSAPPPISLPADPVPTMPAAASPPPPALTTEAPPPLSPDELDGLEPESAAPLGDVGGLSTGAGSLGGLAGSIGGVVGKIVDGIGGLLGSLADGFSNPSEGDSLVDDPLTADDADTPDDAEDDAEADTVEPVTADDAEKPTESPQPAGEVVEQPAAPPPPDAPQPDAAPPADQSLPNDQSPPAGEQSDASTPCEIAEDELPQAGQ